MEAQQETSFLHRQIETFYRVNSFISSIDNLEVLLDLIMQEAEAALEAEASCIALYDPSDDCLNIEFASGEKCEGVRHLKLAVGEGILGQVAATNTLLRVDDVHLDPRFDPSVDEKTGFTTRCILATPIKRHDELLGVLEVINKRGRPSFTDEDAGLLEVVANQAAIAIENARLLDRVIQAERLSLIGNMAASIIHDVRNPLSVIGVYGALLQRSTVTPEKQRAYATAILEGVDRISGMAQELLDYSKGGIKLHLEQVELGSWLEHNLGFLRDEFTSCGIELVTNLDYEGQIRIDKERMRRVLINLASNASDAMPDGGTITISTRKGDDFWELEISDTGYGIPSELRPKIFEPFASFGKEHGTGLGLAIVREIVEGHRGAIRFQSAIAGEGGSRNPGTTFLIRMPITALPTSGMSE